MIKKHGKLLAYMLALAVFTTYVVMDTFVISRVYGEASGDGTKAALQIENSEDTAGNTESGAAENAESGNESSHAKGQGGPGGDGGKPEHGGKHGGPKSRSGSSST